MLHIGVGDLNVTCTSLPAPCQSLRGSRKPTYRAGLGIYGLRTWAKDFINRHPSRFEGITGQCLGHSVRFVLYLASRFPHFKRAFSWYTPVPLLEHMGQFVGQKAPACVRVRPVMVRIENDMVAHRIRERSHGSGRLRRSPVGVDAH
jgi:hypothetical protein